MAPRRWLCQQLAREFCAECRLRLYLLSCPDAASPGGGFASYLGQVGTHGALARRCSPLGCGDHSALAGAVAGWRCCPGVDSVCHPILWSGASPWSADAETCRVGVVWRTVVFLPFLCCGAANPCARFLSAMGYLDRPGSD